MIKHLQVPVMLLLTFHSYAQPKRVTVDSKIETVTVFLKGAEIRRTGSVTVPLGKSELVLEGISIDLDPSSVQVKLEGDLTILSVGVRKNFLQEEKAGKELKLLQEQLEGINDKQKKQQKLLELLKQEESMLVRNQELKSGTAAIKPADLKAALDFQQERLEAVYDRQLAIDKIMAKLEKEKTAVQQQVYEMNSEHNQSVNELFAVVDCRKAANTPVIASYLVRKAGWKPSYSIAVKDINSPLDIQFTANVHQSSGEVWKDIKLVLSSGNPSQNNQKPTIEPWLLRYVTPPIPSFSGPQPVNDLAGKVAGVRVQDNDLQEVVVTGYGTTRNKKSEAARTPDITTTYEPTTTRFEIKESYTISNDGKSNAIDVKKTALPAEYEYYAAPKVDPAAYLTARLVNWQELELMAGEANLFFEGTFLGRSFIDPAMAEDTLYISLGKDANVIVKRTMVKDFSSRRMLGSNKSETKQFELSIRNNKKQPINLLLEDQYPISTMKEIEVERNGHSGARLNDETQVVSWKLVVAPATEEKKSIRYTVKYPKEKRLQLD